MERRNFLGLGSLACLFPVASIATATVKEEEEEKESDLEVITCEVPLRCEKPQRVHLHKNTPIEEDNSKDTKFDTVELVYTDKSINRDIDRLEWEDNKNKEESCRLYNDRVVLKGVGIQREDFPSKSLPEEAFTCTVWFTEDLV